MGDMIRDKEELMHAIARLDSKYQRMLKKGAALERKFDNMLGELSNDKSDLAWDFVMMCESISEYVLLLACKYMDFRDVPVAWVHFSDDYDERKAAAKVLAMKIVNHEFDQCKDSSDK